MCSPNKSSPTTSVLGSDPDFEKRRHYLYEPFFKSDLSLDYLRRKKGQIQGENGSWMVIKSAFHSSGISRFLSNRVRNREEKKTEEGSDKE